MTGQTRTPEPGAPATRPGTALADRAAAALAFAAGALPALVFASPWLGEHDALNFALALERFDLATSAPHFPGYPVYVALGRAFHALGLSPARALAAPGALLLGAGAGAVVLALRRAGHGLAAWFALALAGAAPLWIVTGGSPLSDATGAGLALLAFAAAVNGRTAAAGLAAGVALGARLSLWPFAAVLAGAALVRAARRGERREAARDAAALGAGVALWLVPLAIEVGPAALWAEGVAHTAGHLGAWGGTALQHGLAERARLFARALSGALAGGAALPLATVVAAVWVAGLAGAVASPDVRASRTVRLAAAWAAAYGAWLLFAQNPEHPRHLLPLLPLAAVVAGLGLERAVASVRATARSGKAGSAAIGAVLGAAGRSNATAAGAATARPPVAPFGDTARRGAPAVLGLPAAAAIAAVSFAAALPAACAHAGTEPPALRAARWIARHHAADAVIYYGAAETRLVAHHLPALRAKRLAGGPASAAAVSADLAALGCVPGLEALVAAPAPDAAPPGFVERARFSSGAEAAVTGDRTLVLRGARACGPAPLAAASARGARP